MDMVLSILRKGNLTDPNFWRTVAGPLLNIYSITANSIAMRYTRSIRTKRAVKAAIRERLNIFYCILRTSCVTCIDCTRTFLLIFDKFQTYIYFT